MKNIENINVEQEGVLFKGNYHFLNNTDFDKLLKRVSSNDYNIIKLGTDIYIRFNGDLSDLGNEIGMKVSDYINHGELGYEKEDFISGFKHGLSVADGTHDLL